MDRKTDDEQAALWNGVAGRAWVEAQEPMIAAARARAQRERTPTTFIHDDAQIHAFGSASPRDIGNA